MLDYVIVQSSISPNQLESSVIVKIRIPLMNSTFSSMLGCLFAVVLIFGLFAFFWLLNRGNHDELFPIVILCLGIPPLGIMILFFTFLERYQKEKEQTV